MSGRAGRESPAALVEAVVMVGEVETTYGRAGRGPTVLLLTGRGAPGVAALAPLTARARVIIPGHTTIAALAPATREGATPFAQWLGGFLEGIGAPAVFVVAPAALGAELAAFRDRHPGVVTGVALLGGSAPVAAGDGVAWLPADAGGAAIAAALLGPAPSGGPR